MKTEKRYPSFDAVAAGAGVDVGDWAAVGLLWKPSLDRTSPRNMKYGLKNEKRLICTYAVIFSIIHALGFCRHSEEFSGTESCLLLAVPTVQRCHSVNPYGF